MTDQVKAELLAEREKLEERIREMRETYVGCDWCCGGGDQELEQICDRLAEITELLPYKENP